jgi:hypothetical protein
VSGTLASDSEPKLAKRLAQVFFTENKNETKGTLATVGFTEKEKKYLHFRQYRVFISKRLLVYKRHVSFIPKYTSNHAK